MFLGLAFEKVKLSSSQRWRDCSLSEVKRWRACLGDAEVVKLLPRCGYMAHSTVSLRGGKAVSLSLCSLG